MVLGESGNPGGLQECRRWDNCCRIVGDALVGPQSQAETLDVASPNPNWHPPEKSNHLFFNASHDVFPSISFVVAGPDANTCSASNEVAATKMTVQHHSSSRRGFKFTATSAVTTAASTGSSAPMVIPKSRSQPCNPHPSTNHEPRRRRRYACSSEPPPAVPDNAIR